jgi:hypothetical protein
MKLDENATIAVLKKKIDYPGIKRLSILDTLAVPKVLASKFKKLSLLGPAVSEADEDVEQPGDDSPSNLDDYYDPEDLTNSIDALAVEDIKEEEKAETFGLDKKLLASFRAGGCKNSNVAAQIPLFEPIARRLTRSFFSLGTVYSVGSSKTNF